jgi:hypothetical protein
MLLRKINLASLHFMITLSAPTGFITLPLFGLTNLHFADMLAKLMGCSSPLEGERAKMF